MDPSFNPMGNINGRGKSNLSSILLSVFTNYYLNFIISVLEHPNFANLIHSASYRLMTMKHYAKIPRSRYFWILNKESKIMKKI